MRTDSAQVEFDMLAVIDHGHERRLGHGGEPGGVPPPVRVLDRADREGAIGKKCGNQPIHELP